MGWLEAMATFLMNYGPWGFCALLVVAVSILYRRLTQVTVRVELLMLELIRDGAAQIESNTNAFHQVEGRLAENDGHIREFRESVAAFNVFLCNVEKLISKEDLRADEVRQQIASTKAIVDHMMAQVKKRSV